MLRSLLFPFSTCFGFTLVFFFSSLLRWKPRVLIGDLSPLVLEVLRAMPFPLSATYFNILKFHFHSTVSFYIFLETFSLNHRTFRRVLFHFHIFLDFPLSVFDFWSDSIFVRLPLVTVVRSCDFLLLLFLLQQVIFDCILIILSINVRRVWVTFQYFNLMSSPPILV